jgi:hypothetical protein
VTSSEDEYRSRHSRRMVPKNHSAMAFARGERTGVLMVLMPPAPKTASKELVHLGWPTMPSPAATTSLRAGGDAPRRGPGRAVRDHHAVAVAVEVLETTLAEAQAARLRSLAARAYQVFLDDLAQRGCAALGYRVTGPEGSIRTALDASTLTSGAT